MQVDQPRQVIRLLRNLAVVLISSYVVNSSNVQAQSCPAARGGAMLAALKPGFPIRETIDMLTAAAPHPAIAVVHKSFGSDYEQLRAVINGLINHKSSPSRCVSVVVYIECGPCRAPRRPAGLFPLILPQLSISALNSRLESGSLSTLKAFDRAITYVQKQLPTISGVDYIIEPGLEDNFTAGASQVIQDLIRQEFAGRADWSLGRNRIDNRDVVRPIRKEVHTYDINALSKLTRGDIVTGDGYSFCLPSVRNCSTYSLQQIKALLNKATKLGILVLLWRPEWQGLFSSTGTSLTPPGQRKYIISGKQYIKQLLRRKD